MSLTSLRGASAEAYADLSSELREKLAAGGDATRMGGDLFNVSQLLRNEPSLRRLVTDFSVAAEAKQGLVRGILADKIDPVSAGLVESAVGLRWTAPRDLADALEGLSEQALIRSAGTDSGRLADELFSFTQTVTENPELRDALSDPARSASDKATLVESLLGGKALPATVMLAKQALAGTYRTESAALRHYTDVAASVHGERVATVSVARPLSAADRERLTAALSRQYGKEIHLNVKIVPDVIGGIRVEVGDDVIDGTVSSRLDSARRKLAG